MTYDIKTSILPTSASERQLYYSDPRYKTTFYEGYTDCYQCRGLFYYRLFIFIKEFF